MTLTKVREERKWHLQNLKESGSDTCQREDNMKMTLIRVNTRKNDSFECESDTWENKGEPEW